LITRSSPPSTIWPPRRKISTPVSLPCFLFFSAFGSRS
jgi:hypothetical protein